MRTGRILLIICATLRFGASTATAVSPESLDFFERRIRPVLVEHCYRCHSAEAGGKLKGGLLLDRRDGLLKGGDSGKPSIVPNDPDRSLLLEAIRYTNEDLQMPPKKKLSDQQIADFEAWVRMGAPDPRTANAPKAGMIDAANHWAFQTVKEPPLPAVKNSDWISTPIDRFILAKLEENGLTPSEPADSRTLIRRATFDLTGLPPTPEEVAAFISDTSRDAYPKLIDRLLASPHYGERWARHWLDLARYSDTKGYVYDREERRFVHAHAYRDWVINAFNTDFPYDQFLLYQIAADQLVRAGHAPPSSPAAAIRDGKEGDPWVAPTRRDLAAMGFLTLGRRFLGIPHDIIDDRIDVVTRTTQGLTVACARCHDHKYDPIPTEDYYSLYGVFAGSYEKTVPLDANPQRTPEYTAFEQELQARIKKLEAAETRKRAEVAERLRSQVDRYFLAVLDVEQLGAELFYELMGPNDINPVIVRQWHTYLLESAKRFDPIFAPWNELSGIRDDEFTNKGASILQSLLAKPINPRVAKALAEKPPRSRRDLAGLYGTLLLDTYKTWTEASKDESVKSLPDPAQEAIRQVLYGPDSPAKVPQGLISELEYFFDEGAREELAKLQKEIDAWIITAPGATPHAMILEDRPTQINPRVFRRGNPATKGPQVPRRYLEVIAGKDREPFKHGSGRLELAQQIIDRKNPLTARVMVNRIWLHHFGQGLVRTPSDFGTRADAPTHPELLDHLAIEFMNSGWSVKHMHRLMMLSSTYQQSSTPPTENLNPELRTLNPHTTDPENRLLARMTPTRLDFESMRDSLLFVTGELDTKSGGRPVEMFKPPFPKRRSIYGLVDRQYLPGLFRTFDFANPDLHTPQRHTTTIPQQALFFMNAPFLVERARALMNRADVASLENDEQRIRRLYQILFQRNPTDAQIAAAREFLANAEVPPPPAPPKPPTTAWQYGYGPIDPATGTLKSFTPLPHFTGSAWQGGPNWPDEKLGWLKLTADGGHPGNTLDHAVVRRWTAPHDCTISISGTIIHEAEPGDGIRAHILHGKTGSLATYTLHNTQAGSRLEPLAMKRGQTLDFVVDIREGLNNDQYKWAPTIKILNPPTPAPEAYVAEYNARTDFSGPAQPPPKPLTAWEQYAQVLLLSNEFLFID